MSTTLSPRLRRAVALSLLLALLFGVHALAVPPVLDAYARDANATGQLELALSRYRRAARELPALERELAELQQRGPTHIGYLDGKDEAVAAATLQNRLKALVQRAGGQLRSTQVLAAKDDSAARRIPVRGQLVAGIDALQRLLHEVETASPLLFVDSLDIRAIARPHGADKDAGAVQLDIRLDLYGYLRGNP